MITINKIDSFKEVMGISTFTNSQLLKKGFKEYRKIKIDDSYSDFLDALASTDISYSISILKINSNDFDCDLLTSHSNDQVTLLFKDEEIEFRLKLAISKYNVIKGATID